MALVGHCALSSDDAGVRVHQFMPLEATVELSAVGPVKLRLAPAFPWDGHVRIVIGQTPATAWTLAVRIPGWCNQATLCVNGEPVDGAGARGRYGRIERSWCTGDVAELSIPLPVRLIEPHPRIDAIRGCVAIERGPLVYCLEAVDQQTGAELLDLRIDAEAPTEAVWRGDVLDGVMAVLAPGAVVDPIDWDDVLYRMVGAQTASLRSRAMLMAVPYYAWANRGAHPMRVWIPSL